MGIKHFFMWYKNQFQCNITSISSGGRANKHIDTLLLDLNGIFHDSAQKVFKYGSGAPPKRMLPGGKHHQPPQDTPTVRMEVYADVCLEIDKLIRTTLPRKRIIMAIDGPAPLGKQCQQRQRRFRAAADGGIKKPGQFDSNCITPGTVFMDELGKYIEAYATDQCKKEDSGWAGRQVVFSDEKVPGEGEHKVIDFIRKHGTEDEKYCICGPDGDLIMLALATHKQDFYILRPDSFDIHNEFFLLDMKPARTMLVSKMRWEGPKFNERDVINDFVFLMFAVGNDFLPNVPSIAIIDEGIELMLDIYRQIGAEVGHLTKVDKKEVVSINVEALELFFKRVGGMEKANFERKLGKRGYFPDELMLRSYSPATKTLDLSGYTESYNDKHFSKILGEKATPAEVEAISHDYIDGLNWVIKYYTVGCPSWKYAYGSQYAPTASTLSMAIKTWKPKRFGKSEPSTPFQQLVSVLPPKSAGLLPPSLGPILTDPASKIKRFCPTKVEIDLSGCRKEWEAKTLVPFVDQKIVCREINKVFSSLTVSEIVRNIIGHERTLNV